MVWVKRYPTEMEKICSANLPPLSSNIWKEMSVFPLFFRLILQTLIHCPRHVLAGLLYRESVSDYVVEKQLKRVWNGGNPITATLIIEVNETLSPIGCGKLKLQIHSWSKNLCCYERKNYLFYLVLPLIKLYAPPIQRLAFKNALRFIFFGSRCDEIRTLDPFLNWP